MDGYLLDLHNSSVCKVAKGKVGLVFAHQTDIRLTDVVGHDTQELVDNTHSATFVVRFVELQCLQSLNNNFVRIIITMQNKYSGLTLLRRLCTEPS